LGVLFALKFPSRELDMGLTSDCIFINARTIAVIAVFLAVVAVVMPYFFCEFHFGFLPGFAFGVPSFVRP
jgi:hypothetical protein